MTGRWVAYGMQVYVIARTPSRRPTLQHLLDPRDSSKTICGQPIARWSRAYQMEMIPQIICARCEKKVDQA